jgi:hypothetical protein
LPLKVSDHNEKAYDCGVLINTSDIKAFDPKKQTVSSLLMKLNEVFSPGLPESIFLIIFMRCCSCNDIMTKRVFCYHTCFSKTPLPADLIDLILDTESVLLMETEEEAEAEAEVEVEE